MGETFNWRNYIKLEEVGRYPRNAQGQIRPDLQDRYRYEELEHATFIKVLDQLSQIPEVQEALKKSFELGKIRLAQAAEMYDDPSILRADTRLKVSGNLTDKASTYNFYTHSILIDVAKLSKMQYLDTNGKVVGTTLQEAFIHEILGHAADETLTPQRDFAIQKSSAQAAINKMLNDYPQYQEEYQRSGTVEGLAISALLSTSNPETFDKALRDTMDGWQAEFATTDDIKQRAEEQSLGEMRRTISLYFQNAYRRQYDAASDCVDEYPALKKTNAILSHYFNLPQRQSYETVEDRKAPRLFEENFYSYLTNRLQEISNNPITAHAPKSSELPSPMNDSIKQCLNGISTPTLTYQSNVDSIAAPAISRPAGACKAL